MGRKKVAKRLVLLLLVITCLISIFIFISLYGLNSSEAHKFPTWEYLQDEGESSDFHFQKDAEIIALERDIQYIIDMYPDGRDSNLASNAKNQKVELKDKNAELNTIGSVEEASQFEKEKLWSDSYDVEQESIAGKKNSSSVPGILNVHIWEGWCGPRVEDLKRDKHFPLYPSFKTNLNLFFAQWNEAGYGERIFGYLHPPETGNYTFAVSCDDNCEIWLSNCSNPAYVEKIASVGTLDSPGNTAVANFRIFPSQISKQIYLEAGRSYYIEGLHKQAAYKDHLLLTWLAPSWRRIRTISTQYISSYISDTLDDIGVDEYTEYIPQTKATRRGQIYNNIKNIYYFNRTRYKFGSTHSGEWNYSLSMVEGADFVNILDPFNYKPSYIIDFTPKRYEGVKLIHETMIYPVDNTELTHMFSYEDCITRRDNHLQLAEIVTENGVKTSGDHEHWFNHLSFKERFKYLSTFYSNKIKYFIKKQHFRKGYQKQRSDTYFEKTKKNRGVFSKSWSRQERAHFLKDNAVLDSSKGSRENGPGDSSFTHQYGKDGLQIQSRVVKKSTPMFNLNSRLDNPVINFQEKLNFTSSSYKRRKILSFGNTADVEDNHNNSPILQKHSSDLKFNNLHKINNLWKTDVKVLNDNAMNTRVTANIPKSDEPMFIDSETLPDDLQENSRRSRPIKIPDDSNSDLSSESQLTARNSESPSFVYAKKKKKFHEKRNTRSLLRKQMLSPILNKVFIKGGNFVNGSTISVLNRSQMRWLFNIFGASIYYLSTAPERHFRWLHNYMLSECKTDGNLQLSEEVALTIVNDYVHAVEAKHGRKYSLKRIINIEENHDVLNGDRYLIELELNVQGQDQPQYVSRYVYKPLGSTKLYDIKDFQWNPRATVHIIIPVKNQGRWVAHFIKNMEKIYMAIKDPYLNIIIVDFNSTDINIARNLRDSKLKRYQLVSLDGPFQRALGVQAGVDAVKNPDDIIFACDLHLEIPIHLIQSIRKHTIKAKMAFAPMVLRLSCGYTPELPYGLWEIQGYGLFAISKYDFDRIGGMNTKEFKTKWGGEDWEFLDRTLAHGLEVERMRIPDFYHYYHSKKRMWVSPKSTPLPVKNDY